MTIVPTPPPAVVILLVLLPAAVTGTARLARAATLAGLSGLQRQLGSAIRVLRIDEATHPVVVRSFDGRGLPAFVLIREGVELWRQSGLPEGEGIAALLLSKLPPTPATEPDAGQGPL
ncbi:MAG: thioredoxin [Hymenobacter sp.]|nr:thioredoxin [Hymenobacter sp.]